MKLDARTAAVLVALVALGFAPAAHSQGANSFRETPGFVPAYQPGFRVYYGLGAMDGIPAAKPEVGEFANHASVPADADRQAMLAYAMDVAQGNDALLGQLQALDLMSERMVAARKKDPAGAAIWDEVTSNPAAAQSLVGKARWNEPEAVDQLRQKLQAMTNTVYGQAAAQLANTWRRLANDLMQTGFRQQGGSDVHAILMSTSVPEAQRRLAARRRYTSINQAEENKARLILRMIQMRSTKDIPKPICQKVYFNNEDGTPDTTRTYLACV